MNRIRIADTTLCREGSSFSFKEKLEIARQLERLNVDVIELPEISSVRSDILLVRTISSFVKTSVISVAAGSSPESIENAAAALSHAAHGCIRIQLPLSPVGMEYIGKKKAPAMVKWVGEAVAMAKAKCPMVEFCAVDATRAEGEILRAAIEAAAAAGADYISVCDSAGGMMPDDFAAFAQTVMDMTDVPVGVGCDNKNGLASAQAILAVRRGVSCVKTAVGGSTVDLEGFATMVKNCGDSYGFSTGIKYTELHRILRQINRVTENARSDRSPINVSADETGIRLDAKDDRAAVVAAAAKLGYDLSEEDEGKVYEEFQRAAAKKNVGAKELEAIIATVALQVPAAYKLENYVINNGNHMSSSAQISMSRDGNLIHGVCIGDGPIDAAFLAIEQIIGRHYELDDFQIQAVTEGKEAMGSALVKIRSNGKLYSGNGISTDIIGASIRAYINALNKIVYEEA